MRTACPCIWCSVLHSEVKIHVHPEMRPVVVSWVRGVNPLCRQGCVVNPTTSSVSWCRVPHIMMHVLIQLVPPPPPLLAINQVRTKVKAPRDMPSPMCHPHWCTMPPSTECATSHEMCHPRSVQCMAMQRSTLAFGISFQWKSKSTSRSQPKRKQGRTFQMKEAHLWWEHLSLSVCGEKGQPDPCAEASSFHFKQHAGNHLI